MPSPLGSPLNAAAGPLGPPSPVVSQPVPAAPPVSSSTFAQQPVAPQKPEKIPGIDFEAPQTENIGGNFEGLYKQLREMKDKVKPGNLLRLYDKNGHEFYFQRDDDYEHGFGIYIMPAATS